MNNRSLRTGHILAMGVCALCAQAIFVREIMSLFSGTEFVIGAVLSSWLLWVGMGGILGGMIVRRADRNRYVDFVRLGISAAILLPLTVVAIRLGRGALSRPPGSFPDVSGALLFACAVTAPFGFIYGTLYNVASELWRGEGMHGLRRSVSRVYIWEAIGSLAGALLFSFVLIEVLSQFETAVAVSFAVIAVLQGTGRRGRSFWVRIVSLLIAGLALVPLAPRIDESTIRSIFPGYRIERFLSSKYGEIVAVSREGMLTYFSSGGRLFSVPEPERAEETVHIPLLLHPAPGDVLFIGGAMGGGWMEALKHPSVRRIDCLELDGDLLSLALSLEEGVGGGAYGPGASLDDRSNRVSFVEGDGRFFLAGSDERYDVIILSAPPPINLQWNRYYTLQFFELARRSLAEGGIFAMEHPSSENFVSPAQARVLESLSLTMKGAFGNVLVLPGSTSHLVGSDGPVAVDSLTSRLSARRIDTRFISDEFLPYRFSEERLRDLRSRLSGVEGVRVNTDGMPSLPLYELLLEGDRFGSAVMRRLAWLAELPPFGPVAAVVVLMLIAFVSARRVAASRIAVFSVGMCSFVFQMALLLSYQAYTGLLYRGIVLLTALFMAGAALGASISMKRGGVKSRDLRAIHAGFVLCALLLLGWHHLPGRETVPSWFIGSSLYLLSGVTGILTGAYYPIVVRTALPAGVAPALFYSWDLFGACVGGFLGGIAIVPLAGIAGAVAFTAAIHAGSLFLLAGKW